MRSSTFLTWLLCSLVLQATAQEQLGLKLGNYSGVQSFQLNPSWQVNGPLKWDVNIISLGVFAEQNYIYGQKGSIAKVLSQGAEIMTDGSQPGSDASSTSTAVPFYFQQNKNYNLHTNLIAMAPSFMMNIEEHSFGLYFTGRFWTSGYKLDGDLGYHAMIDSSMFATNFDRFQIGGMAWSEIGATYAKNFTSSKWMQFNAGATVKFLLGFDAASVRNNQAVDIFRNDDLLELGATDLNISYSTGYSEADGYEFKRRGFGIATDIGLSWVGPETNNEHRQYRWKVGVSLLDVGRMWYSNDASVYTYATPDSSYFNTNQFENVQGPESLIDALNSGNNTTTVELSATKFGMWTPMALSVQVDAPIANRLYISATTVIGMRFRGDAIERSDLLAVTPRFETRFFEFGIPISIYRWKDVSLGTYLRMGPLTIGTENLNSYFIPGRLEGSDFYIALKIHSGMFGNTKSKKGSGCFATL